jgi:hypothetical protein
VGADESDPRWDERDVRHRDRAWTTAGRYALCLGAAVCLAAAALFGASAPPALALMVVGEETPSAPAVSNASAPKLAGTPAPGATLTCNPGAWAGSPSSFTYAWLRDGAPIAGQSSSNYTVQEADRGHALACTVTARNEGGEYVLQGLPAGSYEVEFQAEARSDYLSQEFKEKPATEPGDPVTTTAGATTAGLDASLQRGGQISGTVTAALTGLPLKGVEACASGVVLHFDQCASSNASGEYVVSGLPSDSYQLEFRTSEPGQNYAPQYYTSKSKETEATPVAVVAGATIAGVNAALTAGGRIAGAVTGPGSGPVAGAEVCAEGDGGGCAITNSLGQYTITNLATEKYTVDFRPVPASEAVLFGAESAELVPPRQSELLPQYYSGKASRSEAQEVAVDAGATTGEINAALETGGGISGIVRAKEGGAPVAKAVVCAEEAEGESHCTLTSSSGEYHLEGLVPVTYGVFFVALRSGLYDYSDYAPQRYKDREFSEPGDLVTVKHEVTTGGVNAELVVGAQIKGKVTVASSGAPLAGGEACAVTSKGESLLDCAVTNSAGEYALTGLPTGTYTIYFVGPEGSEYVGQIYNDQQTIASADLIPVTTGGVYPGISAALQLGARITGRVTGAGGSPIAGVRVCATPTSEGPFGDSCARTQSAGPAASATSEALSVPALGATSAAPSPAKLTVAKAVSINPKTGAVTFTLSTTGPGALSWNLVFRNSDVAFADSLDPAPHPTAGLARARCKAGMVRHKGRCVHSAVPFASGKQIVAGGTVRVTVHPTKKALRALRSGHTLHISGKFVFQATSGAPGVTRLVAAVVHLPRRQRRR